MCVHACMRVCSVQEIRVRTVSNIKTAFVSLVISGNVSMHTIVTEATTISRDDAERVHAKAEDFGSSKICETRENQ